MSRIFTSLGVLALMGLGATSWAQGPGCGCGGAPSDAPCAVGCAGPCGCGPCGSPCGLHVLAPIRFVLRTLGAGLHCDGCDCERYWPGCHRGCDPCDRCGRWVGPAAGSGCGSGCGCGHGPAGPGYVGPGYVGPGPAIPGPYMAQRQQGTPRTYAQYANAQYAGAQSTNAQYASQVQPRTTGPAPLPNNRYPANLAGQTVGAPKVIGVTDEVVSEGSAAPADQAQRPHRASR